MSLTVIAFVISRLSAPTEFKKSPTKFLGLGSRPINVSHVWFSSETFSDSVAPTLLAFTSYKVS